MKEIKTCHDIVTRAANANTSGKTIQGERNQRFLLTATTTQAGELELDILPGDGAWPTTLSSIDKSLT